MSSTRGAHSGAVPLYDRYAGIVFDIDGVLLRFDTAIPGATETLSTLRERGIPLGFVTNNASRTPSALAATMADAGIDASPDEIVTSALAAAELVKPGSRCLVIGMDGLKRALLDRGCALVREPAEAEVVVVGWDRELVWDDLRRATLALSRGAHFVATNIDASYPADEGPWPGNGAAVAALVAATGRNPEIAGKPYPAVFRAIAARVGGDRLLMVGDRPDTDVAGAAALGWDTALVLTGITASGDADTVTPRPTWILGDVRGLLEPPPLVAASAGPRVRNATAADTDVIVELWELAGMLGPTSQPRRDLAVALGHDPDLVLVAEQSGQVAGVLLASFDGRHGWLQRLAIHPTARRQRLGWLLVAEAERRLTARGTPAVNVLVRDAREAAIAFWDELGYDQGPPLTLRRKRLP
ncbi:MAG: HAD-IIA family hydrolase [Egibacteraceae bacterium]